MGDLMGFIPSGVIKDGWKIPEMNGGLNRSIAYFYGPFSTAMFDYRRVPQRVQRRRLVTLAIFLGVFHLENFK